MEKFTSSDNDSIYIYFPFSKNRNFLRNAFIINMKNEIEALASVIV